jgi:hypothetical protein
MNKRLVSLTLLFISQDFLFAQQQVQDSTKSAWSFSASGYYYLIPGDKNSGTFIGTADYKKLHLEARYNYEDRNTGSAFAGWRLETGNKIQLEVIPVIGIVFGNTNGLAPGLELSVTYKKLDYYSESEWLVDFAGNENNFFYTWSELAISPLGGLRTGMSFQRTRLYQTELDVQVGAFAEYSFGKFTGGVHYFNPFSNDEFVILTLNIDF